MAAETDYYRVLGVGKDASDKDIRSAFRKIAKENHPDKNPDNPQAEQRFKDANEAYQVLSDASKRKLYDTYGHLGLREGFDPEAYEQAQRGFGGGGFRGFGDQGRQGGFTGFGGQGGAQGFRFEDLFQGFRGGSNRGARRQHVQDIRLRLDIDFQQALHGVTMNFAYTRDRVCTRCHGVGGSGGTVCPDCQGRGVTSTQDKVAVKIPKGARSGDVIRLEKRGNIDEKGNATDLLLELAVKEDERFAIDGMDVTTFTNIKPSTLLIGGSHVIEGPWGPITMTLKPGMDPSKTQRIPARGMERGKQKGDLYVQFRVEGETLSDAQQEAIRQALAL